MSHNKAAMRGLAIGGISSDRPRIHIAESFEQCRVSPVDVTYQSGPLMFDELQGTFDVDVVEVFAVNANTLDYEANVRTGALQVAVLEASRQNAAKVDRGQFLDDFAAGAYLNRGFDHSEHISGRHEFNS